MTKKTHQKPFNMLNGSIPRATILTADRLVLSCFFTFAKNLYLSWNEVPGFKADFHYARWGVISQIIPHETMFNFHLNDFAMPWSFLK